MGYLINRIQTGTYQPGYMLPTNIVEAPFSFTRNAIYSIVNNTMNLTIDFSGILCDFSTTSDCIIYIDLPIGYESILSYGSVSFKYTTAPLTIATNIYATANGGAINSIGVNIQNYGGLIDTYDMRISMLVKLNN